MAYNHGKEECKWCRWKDNEEKAMHEYGADEMTIGQLRTSDRAVFCSDRRFYTHIWEAGTYLADVATSEQYIEGNTVEKLLDEIEDINLYRALLEVDRRTQRIILLKVQGYSIKEIVPIVHLSVKAIYARLGHLRKKLHPYMGDLGKAGGRG